MKVGATLRAWRDETAEFKSAPLAVGESLFRCWRARRALIEYNERKSGYGSNNRCRRSSMASALKTTTDVTPRCEILTSVPSGLDSGPVQVGRDEGNEQHMLFVAREQKTARYFVARLSKIRSVLQLAA